MLYLALMLYSGCHFLTSYMDPPLADQTAKQYMLAFTQGKKEVLKTFYDDRSVYESEWLQASFKGEQKILANYQSQFDFAKRQQTIVHQQMVSGPYVVFIYEVRVRANPDFFEPQVARLHFVIPKVAVLRIEDGIVVHHVDQTDFRSFAAQMKKQGVSFKEE